MIVYLILVQARVIQHDDTAMLNIVLVPFYWAVLVLAKHGPVRPVRSVVWKPSEDLRGI